MGTSDLNIAFVFSTVLIYVCMRYYVCVLFLSNLLSTFYQIYVVHIPN